jgi:hypothetical protein
MKFLLFLEKLLNCSLFSTTTSSELSPHNFGMIHEALIHLLFRWIILDRINELVITEVLQIKFVTNSLVFLADGLFLLLSNPFIAHNSSLEELVLILFHLLFLPGRKV